MKILNSLLVATLLLIVGCSPEKSLSAADYRVELDAKAIEKFVNELGKAEAGDFVYFRGIYWRVESIDRNTIVMAGRKAQATAAETYEHGIMQLNESMRFKFFPTTMRGLSGETASTAYVIVKSDEGYARLVAQWTN